MEVLLVIGLRSEHLGVLPPRLLQGPSPSGEPQCTVVVGMQASSGETLVNGSKSSQNPGKARESTTWPLSPLPGPKPKTTDNNAYCGTHPASSLLPETAAHLGAAPDQFTCTRTVDWMAHVARWSGWGLAIGIQANCTTIGSARCCCLASNKPLQHLTSRRG